VREMERSDRAGAVHAILRHLIVDEYQDVNPGQEGLVRHRPRPTRQGGSAG
jgi:superfamily I DNA/RNA helicase